jgi:hypothetical protein
LEPYQERLKDEKETAAKKPAMRSVGRVGEHIQCWLNGIQHWSLPDTGADFNLISSAFARTLGYDVLGRLPIKTSDCVPIQFADYSTTTTRGSIEIIISFCEPDVTQGSTHKLVDSGVGIAVKPKGEILKRNPTITDTFYVIDELEHDVVLGETLLAPVDAYNQHPRNLRKSDLGNESLIAIGRRKKGGEGKGKQHSTLSEEQRFNNNL